MNFRITARSTILFSLFFIISYTSLVAQTPYYSSSWKQVDSLLNQGLTRSALDLVNQIRSTAQKEENSQQNIKALAEQIKLESIVQEKSDSLGIRMLEAEVSTAAVPEKQILSSLLAGAYWEYYQRNRYKILQRTQLAEQSADFQTWDAKSFQQEIICLYDQSLTEKETLQKAPVRDFSVILYPAENSPLFRPSLYDLLAHRALDYFVTRPYGIINPVETFDFSFEKYMVSSDKFMALEWEKPVKLAREIRTLRLFQELMGMHKGKNDKAFIDLELKRLKYLKNHATGDNEEKEIAFEEQLEVLSKVAPKEVITGEVLYEIASLKSNKGNQYNALEGEENRWKKKEAVELCDKIIETYPNTTGAIQSANLKNSIQRPSLEMKMEEVYTLYEPMLVGLSYKNPTEVFFRIVELTPKLADMRNQQNYVRKLLKDAKAIRSWSRTFKNEQDFQEHSSEIAMDGLKNGRYALLASYGKGFVLDQDLIQHEAFQVSNIAYFMQGNATSEKQGMYIRDRESGAALAGAKLQVFEESRRAEKMKKRASGTTNKEGFVEFPYQQEYGQAQYIIKHKKDVLYTNKNYRYRGRYVDAQIPRRTAHFFTDRKIYRPGQSIYFKAIFMESMKNTHELAKNTRVTVSFKDVNGQLLKELELMTNDYGSAQGTFIAPSSGLTGRMSLQTTGGYVDLSVEEYKRPKFEVDFQPVAGEYSLNEEVKVEGLAKAFAGSNIDGAKVTYRVVRGANFPYWYGGYGRRGGYFPRYGQEKEITNGESETDAEGKFSITFTAEPDPKIEQKFLPVFYYKVYADVVDISGETHSAEAYVQVAYTSLNLSLNVPGVVLAGIEDSLGINSVNYNSSPIASQGTLILSKLNAPDQVFRDRKWPAPDQPAMTLDEFRKNFPNDVYKDENNYQTWAKTEVKSQEVKMQGFTNFSLNDLLGNAKPGKYVVELKVKDPSGADLALQKYFTLEDLGSKEPALPQWLYVNLDKKSAEPGETVQAFIKSSARRVWVLYEITQGGEVLEKEYVRIRGKKGEKVSIPIKESYRGGVSIGVYAVLNNEFKAFTNSISVPWTNKQLKLSWSTFRSKLKPGQEEEWRLKISGPKGEAVAAELVASLYDASLDEFRSNSFGMYLYGSNYSSIHWETDYGFGWKNSYLISNGNYKRGEYAPMRSYDRLIEISLNQYAFGGRAMMKSAAVGRSVRKRSSAPMAASAPAPSMEADMAFANEEGEVAESNVLMEDSDGVPDLYDKEPGGGEAKAKESPKSEVPIRKNLQETAFFFPQLKTNAKGEIILNFRIPEALTRWKFLGLAHTQNLEVGTIGGSTVTQKDLMVFPNMPRFLREGDEIAFTAKVSNLGENTLNGNAELRLFDALTMEPVEAEFGVANKEQTFTVEKGLSTVVRWDIKVPENVQAVVTQVIATAGDFSDGEENVLPVLKNSMLVTESMPLAIRGEESKTFTFKKLAESGKSETLKHQNLALEFSSNPAWYAVQSLPYLMEYPHECTEQIFSRFYANALASHMANSSPKVQQVFNQWKMEAQKTPNAGALLSNLEKNQELKAVLLEETPWVLNARSESERKRRIGLLFDLNRMQSEFARANKQLEERQNGNGAFSWFPGMQDSRYITQLIVTGIGYMEHLGVNSGNPEINSMGAKGLQYLDKKIREDYQNLKKYKSDLEKDHLGRTQIQYLYARSFFPDVPLAAKSTEAYNYYAGQGKKFWLNKSKYMQGMLALVNHRSGDSKTSAAILRSLKENAVFNEELGMYWKDMNSGWYWYQAPIERHSLLLEAFNEVTKDQEAVEELKIWLLKNKQTNDWKTTRATVAAINALLSTGTDWLESNELVEIVVGGETIDPKNRADAQVEAGTGYFKTSWNASDIGPEMATVKLNKKDKGIAWGAMYWQYFEQLDKITFAETPLSLKKDLFLKKNSAEGPQLHAISENSQIETGDRISVRVELRVDRAMEYVHMKDMRAAAFEPVETLSSYKYKAGLGYYQSTRDVATHFFFEYLPKGTHVFEYELIATQKGNFSNGITTIQCMYAPEFTSHSEGIRVEVK